MGERVVVSSDEDGQPIVGTVHVTTMEDVVEVLDAIRHELNRIANLLERQPAQSKTGPVKRRPR